MSLYSSSTEAQASHGNKDVNPAFQNYETDSVPDVPVRVQNRQAIIPRNEHMPTQNMHGSTPRHGPAVGTPTNMQMGMQNVRATTPRSVPPTTGPHMGMQNIQASTPRNGAPPGAHIGIQIIQSSTPRNEVREPDNSPRRVQLSSPNVLPQSWPQTSHRQNIRSQDEWPEDNSPHAKFSTVRLSTEYVQEQPTQSMPVSSQNINHQGDPPIVVLLSRPDWFCAVYTRSPGNTSTARED